MKPAVGGEKYAWSCWGGGGDDGLARGVSARYDEQELSLLVSWQKDDSFLLVSYVCRCEIEIQPGRKSVFQQNLMVLVIV